MIATKEIRWFHHGRLPENIFTWFDKFHPHHENKRVDFYLNKAASGMGIKLREEQIQIKYASGKCTTYQHASVVGHIYDYDKWSFPLRDNPEWEYMLKQPDLWVPVDKDRYLLTYEYKDGKVGPSPLERGSNNQCDIELSVLKINNLDIWTFALEAYGDKANEALIETARSILNTDIINEYFTEEKSFGYAALINDINK